MPQAIYRQEARSVDYTPVAAVAGGSVILINGVVHIANLPIAAGALGTLFTDGIFRVVKDTSAPSDRSAIYWDADGSPVGGVALSGAFTTTSSGNTLAGYAIASALTGAETVDIMLLHWPASLVVNSFGTTAITDPGASGAIPVTASGRVAIVTAGAETRTLAAPSFVGQEILIYMKTDGGDCVVTCATTVNETGNNTITFDNTGESFFARAVEEGSNLRWRLAQVDGAALTTV